MNVDLDGRALDREAGLLVRGHADELPAVQDSIDPGDIKIALNLVPAWARSERLSVHLPRVLDVRARLGLASQTNRTSFDDRMLRRTNREVKIAILAARKRHCKKRRDQIWKSSLTIRYQIKKIARLYYCKFTYCYRNFKARIIHFKI